MAILCSLTLKQLSTVYLAFGTQMFGLPTRHNDIHSARPHIFVGLVLSLGNDCIPCVLHTGGIVEAVSPIPAT